MEKKQKLSIRLMAYIAISAALYFALSFLSIKLGNMKISVSGLPVVLAALLFGPLAGFLTGLLGAFLEQVVSFGITVTTVLWILPIAVRGLIVGAYAKHRSFELGRWQLIFITVISALALTVLNTLALYVDSRIFNYYSAAFVFGALLPRIFTGIVTAVFFSLILPPLLKLIRRHIRLR